MATASFLKKKKKKRERDKNPICTFPGLSVENKIVSHLLLCQCLAGIWTKGLGLSGLNNTYVVALCCHTALFLSSLLLGWSRIGWNQQPEAVGGWWSHPERCGQRQILTQSGANHEHTCNSPGVSGDGRWTGTNNDGATAASADAICQLHTHTTRTKRHHCCGALWSHWVTSM